MLSRPTSDGVSGLPLQQVALARPWLKVDDVHVGAAASARDGVRPQRVLDGAAEVSVGSDRRVCGAFERDDGRPGLLALDCQRRCHSDDASLGDGAVHQHDRVGIAAVCERGGRHLRHALAHKAVGWIIAPTVAWRIAGQAA